MSPTWSLTRFLLLAIARLNRGSHELVAPRVPEATAVALHVELHAAVGADLRARLDAEVRGVLMRPDDLCAQM